MCAATTPALLNGQHDLTTFQRSAELKTDSKIGYAREHFLGWSIAIGALIGGYGGSFCAFQGACPQTLFLSIFCYMSLGAIGGWLVGAFTDIVCHGSLDDRPEFPN